MYEAQVDYIVRKGLFLRTPSPHRNLSILVQNPD